ncbi:MAG: hypothetical protein BAA00_15780 [Parageobacillus thermoglucosidasius]|nr:MAG: hypothetical protein BAA00_15780 [Parageobacillus thermoglucosidasius]
MDIKDEPPLQKVTAGGRLPLPLLIFRHSFVREEAEMMKIFTAGRNDRRTIMAYKWSSPNPTPDGVRFTAPS